MNVTVLMGSPFTDGATARLTEAFIRGAREAGHDVKRYDVCELDISPCTREYFAKLDAGEDPDTDDMREILASVLETDVVVFASPLYYYGISAQLKTVMGPLLLKAQDSGGKIRLCRSDRQLRRSCSLEHARFDAPLRLCSPLFALARCRACLCLRSFGPKA